MRDINDADLAREMLALGVIISEFETCFEHKHGRLGENFDKEWETAITRWWELAARYEDLTNLKSKLQQSIAHSASVERMTRSPPGSML